MTKREPVENEIDKPGENKRKYSPTTDTDTHSTLALPIPSLVTLDHKLAAASEAVARKQPAAGTARVHSGVLATHLAVTCQ